MSSGADFYVTEPVRDESLLLVIQSLLARRHIQERVQDAAVRDLLSSAQDAQRAQEEDTLATLGHELRDPLHAMTTWLDVLRDPQVPAVERSKALDRIQRALDLQTDSMCIASDGPVWIEGDAARIRQVVKNLLANAIRFTAVGGNVEVSCKRIGGEAELRVADDGEGIAAELLPHVFEPFRQAERIDTQPQAGLGLGLAIAAYIVQEHRGPISMASAGHGKGATVTVRFPAIPPQ